MHTTLILLPTAAYSVLTLIFARRAGAREISDALVKAHLVIFVFIAVSTETLSAIHLISSASLLTAWTLLLLVSFAVAGLRMHRKSRGVSLPGLGTVAPLTALLVGTIALILLATFATAILYPPNNWDSMTYHMSRVVHWINNNDVSFYPTAITRQNYQMPLAEFAIMHMQILTGLDLFANLVQWVSFLVLICLGLLTAAELDLSNKQQLISAIVISTLPMAILQASSTQNDLVVSSFVMSFGVFMLRIRKTLSAVNLLLAAIALGLALLTKGTAYLYCAAIGTPLTISLLLEYKSRRARLLVASAGLLFIIMVALLLNLGHFLRNYRLYGHPLSTEAEHFRNKEMSAAALAGNIARNGALHLGTPSDYINGYLYRTLHGVLGPQLNSQETTYPGTSFIVQYSRHEDLAGNLIHVIIALFGAVSLPILWCRGQHRRAVWYMIGTMLSAVLYCWIFKWQPWASRLHTPLFAMAAPLLAVTITAENGGVRKCICYIVVLCMVLYSFSFVCANKSRSLISLDWYRKDRIDLYFENRKDLFQGYKDAIDVVQGAGSQEVGLHLGGDDWEYPFWVFALLKRKNGRAMAFRHVGVNNISGTIDREEFLPVYVIATKKIENWKHAAKYTAVYISAKVSVFKRSEPKDQPDTDEPH